MKKEFERVEYKKMHHLNVFFNHINYRGVHFHNEIELLCVFNGNCTVCMPDKTVFAAKGSVVLINHNVAHEIRSESGADFVVIQFSRHTFMDYFPPIRTTYFNKSAVTEGLNKAETAKLWGLIYDLSASYYSTSELAPIFAATALSGLIAFLFKNCPHTVYSQERYDSIKKSEQRMQRIVESMHDEFQSTMLLSELAKREGLTPSHLSHIFHKQLGVTFRDYLNSLRFENALRLMSDESMGISDIAVECGFSDVKYMTKMFRQRFCQTPAQYRKNAIRPLRDMVFSGENTYDEKTALCLLDSSVKPLADL